MTAIGGGRALPDSGAANPADGPAPAGRTAQPRALQRRTVLGLARVEASLLARSLLLVAGLLAGGAVIWVLISTTQPLWWSAGWRIGAGQLILAMTVLVAAQLAAGRVRRDSMADLYASFPATAGTRTLGHLIGLVGAVPTSLLLLGAAAVTVQVRGAIGAPGIVVLAGGVVLVIAAGAAGIAIGTRFAHPLAGVLGAFVLFLPEATSHLSSGAGLWLVPWDILQNQLGNLPGPLAGYPPAAHVLELAGVALLAGVVALALTARGARSRGGLATAGVVAVAVIGFAGAAQLSPLPSTELNHLVAEIADPASVQQCTTANHVRYCLYPGFSRDLPSLEAPVDGVLARVPTRPGQALTVGQIVASQDIASQFLFYGHPDQQVSRWNAQMNKEPGNAPSASAVYLPVGRWPAGGGRLADAHFNVALATAEWAVRLLSASAGQPCVAVDQAREPIAIWLAILATHPPAGELQDGLHSDGGFTAVQVHDTMVPTWNYPSTAAGQIAASEPQLTVAGYLLAKAMTNLPQQKVSQVLRRAWATWLNEHTTDAQLAAALGIRMPSVPLPPSARPGFKPRPGMNIVGQPGPQSPVCTG